MTQLRASRLDRAIAYVAPGLAMRRMAARAAFEALGGGYYEGGRRNRRALAGWRVPGGDANADTIPDLVALRRDSRQLRRTVPLGTAAIERSVTNVVGPGLIVQPQIDREFLGLDDEEASAWERGTLRDFLLWAESTDCDATGIDDFYGLQALAFGSTLDSGDCFAVRRQMEGERRSSGFAIQMFEADQVSTPNSGAEGREVESGNRVIDGVEIDANGAPVAYHFQASHPGVISGRSDRTWTRVSKFGESSGRVVVNHLYERKRIGLTRGVPMLAPVIELLKQLGDYSQAELYAAVIGAMITVVYKSKGGQQLPPMQPTADTGSTASDQDYKIASGSVFEIEHSDDVTVPQLGRPNANFDPFFVAIVRQIGASLEIPFEVLIQHFTASYSASRAALEQAWTMFRKRRQWLVRKFCQWAYEEWLFEAVASGRRPAPGFFNDPLVRKAWSGSLWIGPARISIDPKRENEADAMAEDRGWKTAAENTAEKTGGDWERKQVQRRREIQMTREAGGGSSTPVPSAPEPPDARPGSDRED